jgi:hypothetical protein
VTLRALFTHTRKFRKEKNKTAKKHKVGGQSPLVLLSPLGERSMAWLRRKRCAKNVHAARRLLLVFPQRLVDASRFAISGSDPTL